MGSVAINAVSMSAQLHTPLEVHLSFSGHCGHQCRLHKCTGHRTLLKYGTVLGTLDAEVTYTDDALTIDGKTVKLLSGREPAAMPWKDMGVEVTMRRRRRNSLNEEAEEEE